MHSLKPLFQFQAGAALPPEERRPSRRLCHQVPQTLAARRGPVESGGDAGELDGLEVWFGLDACQPGRLFVAGPLAVHVFSRGRGELDPRQAGNELESVSCRRRSSPEVLLGCDAERAEIPPAAEDVGHRASVNDRRGRRCSIRRRDGDWSFATGTPGGGHEPEHRMCEVRTRIDRGHAKREMVGKPQIVMSEICDQIARGSL